MLASVQKAPCWALQGRAALPREGGWGGLPWDWRHVTQHTGLEQGKLSAKFLVTRKLLFQNPRGYPGSASLSFPRSFCFINNQVLKILPSKYFSKWPPLTWLHWLLLWLPSSTCCLQPFSSFTCITVLYNLSPDSPATFSTVQSALFLQHMCWPLV